ncbi:MAG: NAD(P)/FAD-dependent oxidoreductase [Pseudomonadota bacterium]
MQVTSTDVLIVGAGIAGISAAAHLRKMCPEKSFQIVEARQAIGGTWDLFRYPGIRSDSDMHTYVYSFKPWRGGKVFGSAADIKGYLNETIDDYQMRDKIQLGLKVVKASWSSADKRWTVALEDATSGEAKTVQCQFLFMCSGYYNYESGYVPDFKNMDLFKGTIAHPQLWPADLDYTGKKVLIIGSGATAVTLLPAMAPKAGHVTMLQRSPSYVAARPGFDNIVDVAHKILPEFVASKFARAKAVLMGVYIHRMCRRNPEKAKAFFIGQVREALGPDFDVGKHFTPSYKPWDQRVCMVPDGDLFKALRSGKASMATDHIEAFTETGVKLKSGATIDADIIVPATGLDLKVLGGVQFEVDGKPFHIPEAVNYKGIGYCGLPNAITTFGYTKASWTLKADLTSRYFCRLLKHMQQSGARQFVPKMVDASVTLGPWTDMSSGYFQRSIKKLPLQGDRAPWRVNQAVIPDILSLRFGAIDDGQMVFHP